MISYGLLPIEIILVITMRVLQTAATSSILMYLLAKNPVAQEKLREEVFRVIPDNDVGLQANDLDQMPYMRACIKESMRIHPIISAHVRATGQNLIVEGYQIPKDVNTMN